MIKRIMIIMLLVPLWISAQTTSYKFQIDNIVSHLNDPSGVLTVTTTINASDGYYILGNVKNHNKNGSLEKDIFIAHVDEHGKVPSGSTTYWVNFYGNSGTEEIGNHMIRDYNGDLIVLGESRDPVQYAYERIWILKVSPNGNLGIKKELYGLTDPIPCSARGLEITKLLGPNGPDGYALCGFTQSCVISGKQNPIVVRLDNSLNLTWFRQYNSLNTKFYSIIQLTGGLGKNMIVVGSSNDLVGVMAEVNFTTGALVNIAPLSSGGSENLYRIDDVNACTKVISTSGGGFLIGSSLSRSRFGPETRFMLHQFDASRSLLWGSKYQIPDHDYVQLEDMKPLGNYYHVLLSSAEGLIISRIEIGGSHLPILNKEYRTNNPLTSFGRLQHGHGNYQKLSFDYGKFLNIPQQVGAPLIGNGLVVATNFTRASQLGSLPYHNERREFRLIKTDMQLIAGDDCDNEIPVEMDCSWDNSMEPWDQYGCGMISPLATVTASESNYLGNINPDVFTSGSTDHYFCNEVAYIVEYDPLFRKRADLDINSSEEELQNILDIRTIDMNGQYSIVGWNELEPIDNIYVFNVNGQMVKSFNNINQLIDITKEKSGVYVIKVVSSNKVYSEKVIKQ